MLVTKGTEVCVYCAGAGYLQLVLWGTKLVLAVTARENKNKHCNRIQNRLFYLPYELVHLSSRQKGRGNDRLGHAIHYFIGLIIPSFFWNRFYFKHAF